MKRFIALLFCFILICSCISLPAAAAECNSAYIMQDSDQIIISQTVVNLGNGCYFVETISVPSIQTCSNTKTGTKTATYVLSGTAIYSISVTGTFTYDGSTSKATSASGSIAAHVDGVTLNSGNAYTSGTSAIAVGSVKYNGATLQKTVRLTCDKNGTLS